MGISMKIINQIIAEIKNSFPLAESDSTGLFTHYPSYSRVYLRDCSQVLSTLNNFKLS